MKPGKAHFKAAVTVRATEDGGRKFPINWGYGPDPAERPCRLSASACARAISGTKSKVSAAIHRKRFRLHRRDREPAPPERTFRCVSPIVRQAGESRLSAPPSPRSPPHRRLHHVGVWHGREYRANDSRPFDARHDVGDLRARTQGPEGRSDARHQFRLRSSRNVAKWLESSRSVGRR